MGKTSNANFTGKIKGKRKKIGRISKARAGLSVSNELATTKSTMYSSSVSVDDGIASVSSKLGTTKNTKSSSSVTDKDGIASVSSKLGTTKNTKSSSSVTDKDGIASVSSKLGTTKNTKSSSSVTDKDGIASVSSKLGTTKNTKSSSSVTDKDGIASVSSKLGTTKNTKSSSSVADKDGIASVSSELGPTKSTKSSSSVSDKDGIARLKRKEEFRKDSTLIHKKKREMPQEEPATASYDEHIKVEGRRIVDFDFFFTELVKIAEHNSIFGCNLNSLKVVKEIQNGLESTFHFECKMCNSKFIVNSSNKCCNRLNVNEAAVSGSIMTGIGLSNLNELAASMDLPVIPFRTYSKCHDKVAEKWKTSAEDCMRAAAKEEADAAHLRGDITEDGIPMVPVEADCCWSKRSYKNNYCALSGVAAIIGHHTGKVLHIGVKNKYCVVCARSRNKKRNPPPAHKCTKNHVGSSTSMEPAIIAEGFRSSVEQRNLIYNPLIADGDASTYKKILESRPYPGIPIQKIECTNHLLRNYNGKNLALQKDTSIPLPERKLLTQDRITRLRTSVRAAIRYRNTTDTSESEKIKLVQKDILNSPKHIFGEHGACEPYYCTESRKSEANHTFSTSTLMLKLQRNASQLAYHCRSLLKSFTTNRAEQFNSIVAKTVGGKRINFSLKDSYTVRCYAAVVSFNTGKPQTTMYKSALNTSPGKSLKALEAKRSTHNRNRQQRRKINFRPKIVQQANSDYGTTCQKPDLTEEEFLDAKAIFLNNLAKQSQQRHTIERDTILQAESSLWLELRRCILTASNFAKICKRRPNLSSAPLVKSLLYSYNLDHVASISHGKKNEQIAIHQLSQQENVTIEKCGLFIDEEHCFLGASPDGLYEEGGEQGVVEIKCPFSCFGMDAETAIKEKKLKCFKVVNNEIIFNKNHDWYYQIQGQLHIAKKNVCLFAIWTASELPMKTVRIQRDDLFWSEKMLPKLEKFYTTCVLPEIIDPRKSRSMPLRNIVLN